MKETIHLTYEEIKEITNAIRPTTQFNRLRQMGFTAIRRPDGFPLVARDNFLKVTCALPDDRATQSSEPNWGAI